jgi:flavin reductase (DIM6/NTAB) family NADH-FMN oxidoreductase RutF
MRKPWNIPNLPVYSLATHSNGLVNMNICTYVTAISMKPKWYAIAIYENTQTLINVENSDTVVLQLLSPNHYTLVKILGQKSGLNYNKNRYLLQKDLLTTWNGQTVLKDISAVVLLQKISSQQTGDHHLFIFNTLQYKSFNPEYLTVEKLRNERIIRA